MLPNKSQSSILKGIWFVHHEGNNTIRIHGTNTGREKIYLNDKIVSEQTNLSKISKHSFEDKSGNSYKVNFHCLSIFKGEQECTIIINNKLAKTFKTKFVRGSNNLLIHLLIVVVSTIIFTLGKIYLELPEYSLYIFIILVLIIHFRIKKPSKIEITEI